MTWLALIFVSLVFFTVGLVVGVAVAVAEQERERHRREAGL